MKLSKFQNINISNLFRTNSLSKVKSKPITQQRYIIDISDYQGFITLLIVITILKIKLYSKSDCNRCTYKNQSFTLSRIVMPANNHDESNAF